MRDGRFRLAVTEVYHGAEAVARAVNPDFAGADADRISPARIVGECLAAPADGAWLAAPNELAVWAAGQRMPQATLLVPREPLLARYRAGARVDGWVFVTGRAGDGPLILALGATEFQLR